MDSGKHIFVRRTGTEQYKKARKSTRAFLRDGIVRKSLINISSIGKNQKKLWILHK